VPGCCSATAGAWCGPPTPSPCWWSAAKPKHRRAWKGFAAL
jgi:hypothetical protein